MADVGNILASKLEFYWEWSREMREKSVGDGSTKSKYYENGIRKPAILHGN